MTYIVIGIAILAAVAGIVVYLKQFVSRIISARDAVREIATHGFRVTIDDEVDYYGESDGE
jgi:hypothetical protein